MTISAIALTFAATPAKAELPQPVRAMIEAAMASGNTQSVATVVQLAKQTNPDDIAEIDALDAQFKAERAQSEAARLAEEKEEIRTAGILENWNGRVEAGAFRASGNTSNLGASFGLTLDRKGINWTHRLRGTADYQESNGSTTREQFFGSYEPRYQVNQGLFAYGLAQYERDKFQGFSTRAAVSGGLGYNLLDSPGLKLAVKAGPAFRYTDYLLEDTEESLALLAGFDFNWKVTDRLTITQDGNAVAETGGEATVLIGSSNTTLSLVTGLDARVSDRLSTRLSYAIEYDSDPAPGAVATDTHSRFTLVYGF